MKQQGVGTGMEMKTEKPHSSTAPWCGCCWEIITASRQSNLDLHNPVVMQRPESRNRRQNPRRSPRTSAPSV